jgi:hypothetical protein
MLTGPGVRWGSVRVVVSASSSSSFNATALVAERVRFFGDGIGGSSGVSAATSSPPATSGFDRRSFFDSCSRPRSRSYCFNEDVTFEPFLLLFALFLSFALRFSFF